ncbi:MAG: hypothetical protein KatS3mg103_0565 [Phycisphaerales bacterium]|nr:MAG: hypothetical protein KatS3mg103_0565 [Phycisphaerales bacterium]
MQIPHAPVVLAQAGWLILGSAPTNAWTPPPAHAAAGAGWASPESQPQATDPIQAIIAQMVEQPEAAQTAARRAFDQALAAWPASGDEPLVRAAEVLAVATLGVSLAEGERQALADLWQHHEAFVRALARVIDPANNAGAVVALAKAIAGRSPEAMRAYPELAAAVCVVLDRPRSFPTLGTIRPLGEEVFDGLVYALEDRRVMALRIDRLPAELLVHLVDLALTYQGIEQVIRDHRAGDPLALYRAVPYRQAPALGGPAVDGPRQDAFDRIAREGGTGPVRCFYAEQIGQVFGWPVASAVGHLGEERFRAPVFLEERGQRHAWNLQAICEHPGVALGSVSHPVSGQPMPLDELVATADLAQAGIEGTRLAWGLLQAAQQASAGSQRLALLEASQRQTLGLVRAWAPVLEARLEASLDEPSGPQRVLQEFFDQADSISPMLATRLALEHIARLDGHRDDLLAWMALTSRRDPHRHAAAQIAIGDAALATGDPQAAARVYEELLMGRLADQTPLMLDALARLEALSAEDRPEAMLEIYARLHRRLRPPRSEDQAVVLASAYMVVGRRYEALLRRLGRSREADRLAQQLERALR